MYLHAAANGSRTYGRTGLKCQNGWHALCGMAPTLWSSIRHVDRRGNIARRERLCLWVLCVVSAGRYALFTKFDRVHCRRTRDARNRYSWCLGGRRAARAREDRETGVDERPKPRRCGSGRRRSGPGTGPAPATPRGVDARASVRPGPRTPPDITRPVKVLSVESVRLTDNILYSKCLLVISFKTLHQRFHHALER
jgi:hypothetical protein